MFTIKYRSYSLARSQNSAPDNPPLLYDENEQLHGPFELVSKEQDENGNIVVHAHRAGGAPSLTLKHCGVGDPTAAGSPTPRSTVWVMNDQGATVAKYDL